MTDPLRSPLGWPGRSGLSRLAKSETEQIERRDRVSYAASLIRDHELRLWFERDWSTADLIASRCPECVVFSIPTGAFWIDDLDQPPPWRRPKQDNGIV